MLAEIISIGDEITRGQTLDTNSQWLSRQLELLGVKVLYHSTVADELQPNVDVFRLAIERADVVLVTGGLGPTADDLTREALAQATHCTLVLDPQALQHVRGLFARRKRPMPPQNEVQAYLPSGADMIDNPHGTAPGIYQRIERDGREPCHVIALPGVPAEMKLMWDQSVVGLLRRAGAGRRVIRFLNLRCFGAGESQIEAMLPDLVRRGRQPTVGITASQATISLRIVAEGESEAECQAQIDAVAATIRQCLGDLVYGQQDEELQHVVLELLGRRGLTLATSECGTSALLADWLSTAAAATKSPAYRGGVVFPTPEAAAGSLALADPADHRVLTETMAAACRQTSRADFGLAVGLFPTTAPDDTQAPPVHIALAGPDGVTVRSLAFILHPALVRVYFAKQALNMLRLKLLA